MLEDAEIDWFDPGHFTLLDSSLVQQGGGGTPTYEGEPILIDSVGRQHTLESYERSRSARRGRQGFSNGGAQPSPPITSLSSTARPVLPHIASSSQAIKPPRWNFGIRSSSPPMEVMCELYRSVKHLGAEWREKDHPWSFVALPYPPMDHDDITPATDIFFIQTRWKLRDESVSCHPTSISPYPLTSIVPTGPSRYPIISSACVQLSARLPKCWSPSLGRSKCRWWTY